MIPELRYYPESDQTTNEAAIASSLLDDLYVVIGNKDEQENYAVRIYHKPLILLLWLGCVMIFTAAMVGVVREFKPKSVIRIEG